MMSSKFIYVIFFISNVCSFQFQTKLPGSSARINNYIRMVDSDVDSIIDIIDDQKRTREFLTVLENSKRSYLDILVERFGQTIDDFQLNSKLKSLSKQVYTDPLSKDRLLDQNREKVVILGTGWGSYSLCKSLDSTLYDVKIISPRNHFLFTPMLAASAVGTVEFKSISDPIRNVNPFIDYLDALAVSVDLQKNVVSCDCSTSDGTSCTTSSFDINYDYLIIAVGAATNTYGIKGVRENCLFLKQLEDASNIRKSIISCFERANIPGSTEDEIRNALSFVIVGAGPTGVEFTSELRDWIEHEGRRYYSNLLKYVKIYLVEAGDTILPIFDEALRKEGLKILTSRQTRLIEDGLIDKEVTSVLVRAGVKEIGDKSIFLSTGETIPYGFCVWAAGNGCLPFVQNFIDSIEVQKSNQAIARGRIVTDRWLKVLGTNNVYSIGDCSFVQGYPLPATAQVASQGGAYLGRLFTKEYYMKTPQQFPPLKFQFDSNDDLLMKKKRYFSESIGIGRLGVNPTQLELEQYLNGTVADFAKPFQFLNLGVLAYVGASKALAQVSVDDKFILGSGTLGFLLWRGVYWFKQVSWRNRFLVAIDWFRAIIFGRDIGAF